MPQSDSGLAPKCINKTWHKNSKSMLSANMRISYRQAGEMKEKARNAEVSVGVFSNSGYVRCICLVMPNARAATGRMRQSDTQAYSAVAPYANANAENSGVAA